MKPVDDCCQDLGYKAGLIHLAGLSMTTSHSRVSSRRIADQFVVPEERACVPMQEMEAEWQEIGVAEGSGLHIQYPTSFGSAQTGPLLRRW
jgi:hypothetical protein